MYFDLKNSYYHDMKEVKELAKYYGWNKKQIIKHGFNKKLLDSAREIKEIGI